MIKIKLSAIVLILIGLIQPNLINGQKLPDVYDEIEALHNEKIELTLAGRYDELAKFYSEGAISMPNYEKMARGVDEIIRSAEKAVKNEYKVSEIKLKPVEVFMDKHLLVEAGTIIMKVSGPGIPGKVREKGKYMTLWENQPEGGWKIKAETWNVDVNPLDRIPGAKTKGKKRKKD
jgi:ketosteroid isomerase-like protein